MSDASFTPGPWVVHERTLWNQPLVVGIDRVGPTWTLAKVYQPAGTSAALPNASLIAAAPDLFEALRIIHDLWASYTDPDAESPGWPDDAAAVMNDAWKDGFYDKATAALAKARGAS